MFQWQLFALKLGSCFVLFFLFFCVEFNLLSVFRFIYRRAFTQLSVSPEAFLTLRSHFASSHACLCICQYILGIGDRHLSNFMVDMETGGMIGIDFGHAFGSATQV